MALLQKIAVSCPAAAEVVELIDNDTRHTAESTNFFNFSKYDRFTMNDNVRIIEVL